MEHSQEELKMKEKQQDQSKQQSIDALKNIDFWKEKPILNPAKPHSPGSIKAETNIQNVRKDPYDLPRQGMFWCTIDISSENSFNEFHAFLSENKFGQVNPCFEWNYSRQYLRWVLSPPKYEPEWLIGVKNQNKELIGSIAAVPVTVVVEGVKLQMAEITFLGVDKSQKIQKLTDLLIQQMARRINLKNIWQTIYSTGKTMPTPFASITNYHRPIFLKKLLDTKFMSIPYNKTYAMMKKLYLIADELTIDLHLMNKNDVSGVTQLLNDNLEKYLIKKCWSEEDVFHYFMPRDKFVYTYVNRKTLQTKDGSRTTEVTDFLSFYIIQSTNTDIQKQNKLFVNCDQKQDCRSFYNIATTVSYEQLIKNALIIAQKQGFDVYSCMNLMENATILDNLHFAKGIDLSNYYFYNWIMKKNFVEPSEIGVVLL